MDRPASENAGIVESSPELTPALLDEIRLTDRRLADLKADLPQSADCGSVEIALGHIAALQGSLGRVEHALQSTHLGCCVLPGIEGPAEFGLALGRLSASRTGALVVVEQTESLDEYVARGTVLDAQLSATLLESLFYPGSMLHDGAAIVRAGRIVAAGVFLPLATERRDVVRGRLLGARHRAALGLSAVSDALVFVVSEETGDVSLALRGKLHHGIPVGVLLGRPTAGGGADQRAPQGVSLLRRWLGTGHWWGRHRARS